MAFGLPYELPWEQRVATLDLTLFDRYAGRYANVDNAKDAFVFRRDGAWLLIESPSPAAWSLEVFAESATRLFARVVEWDRVFTIDAQGKVTELRTRNQGVTSTFRPSP
jgi:hypothetical protein